MEAQRPVAVTKPHVTGSAAETAASRGRTDVQYPLVVNIVRIFTSSTFTGLPALLLNLNAEGEHEPHIFCIHFASQMGTEI